MKKILISPYTYIGLIFIIFIVVAMSNTYAWFNWQSTDDLRFEVKIGNVNPPGWDAVNKVNKPNIVDGMIPIKYNNTLNRWEKADITNVSNDWYDYNNKKWANTVLVTDASRTGYMNAPVGTEIKEANILVYLVWIPRYRYQLWNASNTNQNSNEQEVQIEFESTITPPSCGGYARNSNGYDCTGGISAYDIKDNTSNYSILGASRMYESATNTTWLTHPAFKFGEIELDGFWVGKFETSDIISDSVIKPNKIASRGVSISLAFSDSSKFKTQTSYGISTSDMDSRVIKNIEWGAVSYLSRSKYGKNSEIFINPSSGYITGRSGSTASQSSITDGNGTSSSGLYSYNGYSCLSKSTFVCSWTQHATYGMAASTTGNIYGIYDMSGGTNEYVMGNMSASMEDYNVHQMYPHSSGSSFVASDGITYNFVTLPKKYYDIYSYDGNSYITHNRGILGDAIKETLKIYGNERGGWYSDYSLFLTAASPWIFRGGANGSTGSAGIFGYSSSDGSSGANAAYRLVLSKY